MPAGLAAAWPLRNPITPTAIGKCSTAGFLECPNTPEHHVENAADWGGPTYWDDTGRYYWLDFELEDDAGHRRKLRLVYNEGDGDCNDGRWGGVWDLQTDTQIADLMSTGDCETTIAQRPELGEAKYSAPEVYLFNKQAHPFYSDVPYAHSIVLASDSAFERIVLLAMRWTHILSE